MDQFGSNDNITLSCPLKYSAASELHDKKKMSELHAVFCRSLHALNYIVLFNIHLNNLNFFGIFLIRSLKSL